MFGTTTDFLLGRDQSGVVDYSRAPSNNKVSVTLAANTEATTTVPNDSNTYKVVFSIEPGSTVWVAIGATAAVPAGATFAVTNSMLNPTVLWLEKNKVIHAITADSSADVGIEYYAQS